MTITLEAGGKVTGSSIERGKFVVGSSASGKIKDGKWWAEGYVELTYVFWDGSTYTYRCVVLLQHCSHFFPLC
jgi:hypothetical protein